MVKFIHAADLHLDSPFKGLKQLPRNILKTVKESTFLSLRNIVNEAIKNKVDFVLLAGDIYDIDDRSIKAQVFLKDELERLKAENIPVFLIHGNHDYQANNDAHLSMPSNVTVFSEAVGTRIISTSSGERVAISGFTYNQKWIEERKIKHYPQRSGQADYHIGLLHGYAEGQESEHARYAPFSLSELREKNYDYWALGHIHKRQQLSKEPLVYYSGNTQGRNKKETGEKGCLLVELLPASSHVSFIQTAPIIWERKTINAVSLMSLDAIFEAVKTEISDESHRSSLIHLTLIVSNDLPKSVIKKIEQAEFYEAATHYYEETFSIIVEASVKIELKDNQVLSLNSVFPSAWLHTLEEISSKEEFNQVTDELYSLHAYSKYLMERDRTYRNEMIDRAVHLLLQDLGEEGVNHDY